MSYLYGKYGKSWPELYGKYGGWWRDLYDLYYDFAARMPPKSLRITRIRIGRLESNSCGYFTRNPMILNDRC
jgi:hypothetical protein